MKCVNCEKDIDAGSKHCPDCAYPQALASLSAYEAGKLSALTELRKEMFQWFASFSIIVSLIAFFGAGELIKNSVSNSVQEEFLRQEQSIFQAREKTFESLAEAKSTRKKLEGELSEAQEKSAALNKGVDELSKTRDALLSLIDSQNAPAIFAKMKYDFYRVREVIVRTSGTYEKETWESSDVTGILHSSIIGFYNQPTEDDKLGDTFVQFRSGKSVMVHDGKEGTVEIRTKLSPIQVFEEALSKSKIQDFERVSHLKIQFPTYKKEQNSSEEDWSKKQHELIEIISNNLEALSGYEFTLVVNGVEVAHRKIDLGNYDYNYLVENLDIDEDSVTPTLIVDVRFSELVRGFEESLADEVKQ